MSRGLGHKRRGTAAASPRASSGGPAARPDAAAAAAAEVRPAGEHRPSRPDERRPAAALNPGILASIAIAGTSSNAGKTWIGERLLAALADAGVPAMALKVTRTHVGNCPRENDACGVCDDLALPFEIVRDRDRLAVPRKDTGRYVAAGAADVRWLLVHPDHVAAGAAAAIAEVPVGWALVAEGNSLRDYVDVDLTLMALSPDGVLKASARPLLDRVDAFVGTDAAARAFRERCAGSWRPDALFLVPEEAAAFAIARVLTPRGAGRPVSGAH